MPTEYCGFKHTVCRLLAEFVPLKPTTVNANLQFLFFVTVKKLNYTLILVQSSPVMRAETCT